MRRGLTILMYHRVLPPETCSRYPLKSLVIPTHVFSAQVRWLAQYCRVLPVRQALESLAAQTPQEKPLLSITFDDGYADNYELAAPILEQSGLAATFFVTTGFIESRMPPWYDRAADAWQRAAPDVRRQLMIKLGRPGPSNPSQRTRHITIESWMAGLKDAPVDRRLHLVESLAALSPGHMDVDLYRPMSEDHVAALLERGHEIASHTVNHAILTQIDGRALRAELQGSLDRLKTVTGRRIAGFSYPNGNVDERVERAVTEAGYDYACTMESGLNEARAQLTRLARISITMARTVGSAWQHDDLAFRAEVCRFREWCRR